MINLSNSSDCSSSDIELVLLVLYMLSNAPGVFKTAVLTSFPL